MYKKWDVSWNKKKRDCNWSWNVCAVADMMSISKRYTYEMKISPGSELGNETPSQNPVILQYKIHITHTRVLFCKTIN